VTNRIPIEPRQPSARGCVSFHHEGGEYSNTAKGESLFDAAAKASISSAHRTGKGRALSGDAILHVTILGDQQRYRVLAGRIER